LRSARGEIKHVVYIQFDNVHFTRDNPNVLSDRDQMPHLLNFFVNNATLCTNHHTPLIAHTADDIIITALTGVSNSFNYFNPLVPTDLARHLPRPSPTGPISPGQCAGRLRELACCSHGRRPLTPYLSKRVMQEKRREVAAMLPTLFCLQASRLRSGFLTSSPGESWRALLQFCHKLDQHAPTPAPAGASRRYSENRSSVA
jgi:hypothetical protein